MSAAQQTAGAVDRLMLTDKGFEDYYEQKWASIGGDRFLQTALAALEKSIVGAAGITTLLDRDAGHREDSEASEILYTPLSANIASALRNARQVLHEQMFVRLEEIEERMQPAKVKR